MEDKLITFETAKLAKEKGFNIPSSNCYSSNGEINEAYNYTGNTTFTNEDLIVLKANGDTGYLAPTQSLLLKWLRETQNIDVVLSPERYKDGVNYIVQAQKWDLKSDEEFNPNFTVDGSLWFNDNSEYPSYELALEKGLIEALKLT
jgi:hypothetical protein